MKSSNVFSSPQAFNPTGTGPNTIFTQACIPRSYFSAGAYGMIRPSKHRDSYFDAHTRFFGHHASLRQFRFALETSPKSLFDTASITKSIPVALLVLWLVSSDRLALNQKITQFFPGMKVIGSIEPTILHLLTYTARFHLDHLTKPYERFGAEEIQEQVFSATVTADTEFNYSNYPAILLTRVVEIITEMSLPEIAQIILFDPLGVRATFSPSVPRVIGGPGDSAVVCTEIEQGSNVPLEGIPQDEFTRASGLLGASGLFATCDDLLVLLKFILEKGVINGKQVINHELIQMIGINHVHTGGTGFGLGFGLWEEFVKGFDPMTEAVKEAGLPADFAEGAFFKGGFTGTLIACFPKIEIATVILANMVHPIRHESTLWGNCFKYSAVMQLLTGQLPYNACSLWKNYVE